MTAVWLAYMGPFEKSYRSDNFRPKAVKLLEGVKIPF
jgi:hypothetical protein